MLRSSVQTLQFLYTPIAGHVLARFQDLPAELADSAVAVEAPERGQEYAFYLRASPTRKTGNKRGSFRKDNVSGRLDWLARRGRDYGFEMVDTFLQPSFRRIDRKPRPFGLDLCTFTGRLRVTDPAALWCGLGQGIGRARAWGCGLMVIS